MILSKFDVRPQIQGNTVSFSSIFDWFELRSSKIFLKFGLFRPSNTYRYIQVDSFHIHFINKENKGLVPVGIQVARLDTRLLFLANSLALKKIKGKILAFPLPVSTRKYNKFKIILMLFDDFFWNFRFRFLRIHRSTTNSKITLMLFDEFFLETSGSGSYLAARTK